MAGGEFVLRTFQIEQCWEIRQEHRKMKKTNNISVVLVLFLAGQALCAPLITRVDPPDFVAVDWKEMKVLTIRGYHIWEGSSGHEEYVKRTKVYIRREGAFQHIRTYAHGFSNDGSNTQKLEVNVRTQPWFASAGTFEVMVKVDGKESNYYQVPVLEGPPNISKLNPSEIALTGKSPPTKIHEVRIVCSNLGNYLSTAVLLDDRRLTFFRPGPGVLAAFVPESRFSEAGKFALQIQSSAGLSEKKWITFTAPPSKDKTASKTKPGKAAAGTIPLAPRGRKTAPPVKITPLKPKGKVVVEGEALISRAKTKQAKPTKQQMSSFGRSWSQNAQLYWNPNRSGVCLA